MQYTNHLNDMPEYSAYYNARARCSRKPGEQDYADYAGRGIKFLFKTFAQFLKCVGMKPHPDFMLDRENNDGNYEPGNVHWVSASDSKKNQRMTPARIEHNKKAASIAGQLARRTGQAKTLGKTYGPKQGRKNVASGQLVSIRTQEHQRLAGAEGGKRAVKSGQVYELNHLRWHTAKGITKEGCKLCSTQKQG